MRICKYVYVYIYIYMIYLSAEHSVLPGYRLNISGQSKTLSLPTQREDFRPTSVKVYTIRLFILTDP